MPNEKLRCGELIKRIGDVFETNANKNLQENGITLSQMKMLVVLYHTADGSAMLKELEQHFGSSQATIAGIASRLERKGLVESYIDASDRRIKHVRLSEAGKQLCCRSKSSMEAGEAWLLAALEPQEQQELQRLLQKVYDHL